MLFRSLPIETRKHLSNIGLNCHLLAKSRVDNKLIIVGSVADAVEIIRNNIVINRDDSVYYELCECKFFKRERLLKGIWTCKNNIYPSRLIKLMKVENNRTVLIERLDMIIHMLTTTGTY